MASPASVPGHPIQPIIIPFPIGLGVFSLVADVIYLWRGNPIWKDWISFYTLLGGIVGAALAAVCGINRLANKVNYSSLPFVSGSSAQKIHWAPFACFSRGDNNPRCSSRWRAPRYTCANKHCVMSDVSQPLWGRPVL